MPTIIELGQKVKAKYPQYADMSDEEVGKRVKAKYPTAYMDFTDVVPQQKTQSNQLSKPTVGQAAGQAAKSFVTEAVPNALIGGAKGALSTVQGMSSLGQKILGLVPGNKSPIFDPLSKYTKPSTQFRPEEKQGNSWRSFLFQVARLVN